MKVTITSAVPTERGLRLALRVEHERAGWIRFCASVLLYDDITDESLRAIVRDLELRRQLADERDEPLPLSW